MPEIKTKQQRKNIFDLLNLIIPLFSHLEDKIKIKIL